MEADQWKLKITNNLSWEFMIIKCIPTEIHLQSTDQTDSNNTIWNYFMYTFKCLVYRRKTHRASPLPLSVTVCHISSTFLCKCADYLKWRGRKFAFMTALSSVMEKVEDGNWVKPSLWRQHAASLSKGWRANSFKITIFPFCLCEVNSLKVSMNELKVLNLLFYLQLFLKSSFLFFLYESGCTAL